jgi:hypothetical protein
MTLNDSVDTCTQTWSPCDKHYLFHIALMICDRSSTRLGCLHGVPRRGRRRRQSPVCLLAAASPARTSPLSNLKITRLPYGEAADLRPSTHYRCCEAVVTGHGFSTSRGTSVDRRTMSLNTSFHTQRPCRSVWPTNFILMRFFEIAGNYKTTFHANPP